MLLDIETLRVNGGMEEAGLDDPLFEWFHFFLNQGGGVDREHRRTLTKASCGTVQSWSWVCVSKLIIIEYP